MSRTSEYAEEYYDIGHKFKKAIIFNHSSYRKKMKLDPRIGTDKDRDNLVAVLKLLGFSVEPYNNKTYEEIMKILHQISERDHSKLYCLLIIVMTHGRLTQISAQNKWYNPSELWSKFDSDKCPTLIGKPKLFFIQACSGNKFDKAITLRHDAHNPSPSMSIDSFANTSDWHYVRQADFLVVKSSAPGFYSFRNERSGTWFIQALCKELRQSENSTDILTIVTRVFRIVATDYNYEENKQMPYFTSTLTRLLVLKH